MGLVRGAQFLESDWPELYPYSEERFVQSCIKFHEALLRSREDGWSLRWNHIDANPKKSEYQPIQTKGNGSTGAREDAETLVQLETSISMVQDVDGDVLEPGTGLNTSESTYLGFQCCILPNEDLSNLQQYVA